MLSDEAAEAIPEPTVSPAADPEQQIQEAKHKCFERMEQEPPYDKPGSSGNLYVYRKAAEEVKAWTQKIVQHKLSYHIDK